MNNKYTVPIIPYNLSKQETIIQIAEILDHLSNVTEDLLKRIDNRIESNNGKLSNISDRLATVNSKITKLTGAKKATQVFSSCKYPASDVNKEYVSVFSEVKPIEIKRHKMKYKKQMLPDDAVLDKLYVYHVKMKHNDNSDNVIKGLGKIPNDINYVNDLLLYNSGKNLYKNFVISDALVNMSPITRELNYSNINDSTIGAAPLSISDPSTMTRSSTQTYFYTPNLGEVPTLDVPLDLPDLPGIADDLRYDIDELGHGIAPSVSTTITPNIPELPAFDEPSSIIVIDDNLPANIVLPTPPSPPPPTTTTTNDIPIDRQPINAISPSPSVLLPTPPPPPVQEIVVAITPQPPPQSIDAHSSLMEAIRNAGGSRKAKLKTTEQMKTPTMSAGNGGNDLMADLHEKLSRRRKGISGAKKQDMDVGSAMEKISAMIPPPTASTNNDSTDIDDEDWD